MEYNNLTEQLLGDIILCDPVTSKGKDSLYRLGLSVKEITPSYFYKFLRAESKYDENKEYDEIVNNRNIENSLYYQYTVDNVQFKSLKNQLSEFNKRFSSDKQHEYPLFMIGVAGNGKSIEINRKIREVTNGEYDFECGRAYFNLEDAFTEKTYGVTYICPDENDSLWLFCIKLLDGIMQYLRHCSDMCPIIIKNFKDIIVKHNLANNMQKELFENIGNYRLRDNNIETEIFQSLINMLNSKDACSSIKILFKNLMLIMFCTNPLKKQYIVIDNIEQYIKLNEAKIPIHNSDIIKIYNSINSVVTNISSDLNRIEANLSWKAFKIIIVLRRTSIGLFGPTLLQSVVQKEKNINDITGYYLIPDIWNNKKKYLWDNILKDKFIGNENKKIIKILDFIMNEGNEVVGTSYQALIAPLMSYGIRRNARAQAHASYELYETLSNKTNQQTIDFDEFNEIMYNKNNDSSASRYMFRRALLEFQFKWTISNGNRIRWRKLNIGHLIDSKEIKYCNKSFTIQEVTYENTNCIALLRRTLSFLSHFIDENNSTETGYKKSVANMFSTISLYDLVDGVLIDPSRSNKIKDDEFLQLANVIIALSDMSNGDTKCAPFVILGVNDKNFNSKNYEEVLASILKRIYESGRDSSLPNHEYSSNDFGIRITDSGYSFLLDWQASYSFFSSLYCFTIPSLFFLKDIESIKYLIETVYNKADNVCKKYESEAKHFCGVNMGLESGNYLPKYNGKYITYRKRVKDLHLNHLNLYKTYIINNYNTLKMSLENMQDVVHHISKYIDEYSKWIIEGDDYVCF